MAGMVNWMQIGNSSGQATQAGLELYNAYRLNQKLKGMDDTYRIPPEIQANLNDANSRALEGLPTAYANQYRQQLANNSAYANTNLGSLSAGIRGIAGTQNAQNAGDSNLLAMNSQAQAQNQNTLYGMRNQMADYKDMAWKHNIDDIYRRTEDKKDAYFTAAGRQFSNAMASGAGSSSNGSGLGQGDAAGGGSKSLYGTGTDTMPSNNGYMGESTKMPSPTGGYGGGSPYGYA